MLLQLTIAVYSMPFRMTLYACSVCSAAIIIIVLGRCLFRLLLVPYASKVEYFLHSSWCKNLTASFTALWYSLFRQEGIRLEAEDPKNPASPIVFKGVVFNEMKGVFSNPENMFGRKIQNYLLPTGTYSHESGGDPLSIPDLTWEQLRQFHKSYYHPSNCRFYTYGDMPLESHLENIQQKVLTKFQKTTPDSVVQTEPRWTSPKEVPKILDKFNWNKNIKIHYCTTNIKSVMWAPFRRLRSKDRSIPLHHRTSSQQCQCRFFCRKSSILSKTSAWAW